VAYDQRLPLPPLGPTPMRRYRRFWFASGRDRIRVLLLALGVAAAVAGGLLGVRQPVVNVQLDAQYYRVGSITLPEQGDGVYAGPEGAIVIQQSDVAVSAGGSTSLRGAPTRGSCVMAGDGRREHCQFQIGDRAVGADDTRTTGGWRRRYQDGQTIDIGLPRGPVPVPFPIGR
jgi:hypothetical protein